MRNLLTAGFSIALLTFVIDPTYAAGRSMSKSDTTMMKKCQGMSESAMMKNQKCMAMMKKHPDMMNGGTNGSGSMGGSMKSGGMK